LITGFLTLKKKRGEIRGVKGGGQPVINSGKNAGGETSKGAQRKKTGCRKRVDGPNQVRKEICSNKIARGGDASVWVKKW